MRSTLLFAIGLVFLSLALMGTIYRFILQSPGELRSVVYIAGAASQPSATRTGVPVVIESTDTPQAAEPSSTPVPRTPTPTRSPTATRSPTTSPTGRPFHRVGLCVVSESANYINVRSGPGTVYPPLGEPLAVDTCLFFSARNEEATWLQVAPDQPDPSLRQYEGGWIDRKLLGLGATGPIDLPAVTLTPTPLPSSTSASALSRTNAPSAGWNEKRVGTLLGVENSGMSLGIPAGETLAEAGYLSSNERQPGQADASGPYLVEAEWPPGIEVKQPGRIRISLIKTEEGYTPVVELAGSTVVVFRPTAVGTPDQDLGSAFGAEYRPYAAVAQLIGVSFNIDPAPVSEPRLLDQPRVEWIWSLSSDNPGNDQGIDIILEIEWKRIGDSLDSIKRTVWREHIEIDIYQRLLSAGQINLFSLFSAFLGSGLSIPWLYEKISQRRSQRRKKAKKRT